MRASLIDARIYVLGANNTPWGPLVDLPQSESKIALTSLVKSLDCFLEKWDISGNP